MTYEALTLPGISDALWQRRTKSDHAAVALANRHYSRERRGARQVGGPRPRLVFVTPCERAVWISEYNLPGTPLGRGNADALDAWRCTMFRNEGAGLSSTLILAAMDLTASVWGDLPPDGWVTWVEPGKISSRNPGACFKHAGWGLDREWSHPRLIRLRYP